MKVLLLVTLVAAASCEANPGFAYHTGVLPWYPYAGHVAPYAAHVVPYHFPSGCLNNAGHVVPCALPAAAAAAAPEVAVSGVEEARKKRDADPAVLAATTRVVSPAPVLHGYHGLHGLGYGAGIYGVGLGHGWGYGFGYPVGLLAVAPAATAEDGAVEEARKKREADPYLFYGHGGYAGYGHAGYGYAGYSGHLGYAGYGGWPYAYGAYLGHHGVGCRNNAGALVPCA